MTTEISLRQRAQNFEDGTWTWVRGWPPGPRHACLVRADSTDRALVIWPAEAAALRAVLGLEGDESLVSWNDEDPTRRVTDVIAALRAAADLLGEPEL